MTITNGEQTMTLEELALKICNSFDCNERDDDCKCPAQGYCWKNHNGMLDWLREVLKE